MLRARDSSAIKFDRVEIAFIWALFCWLNHETDEGGEETGVPGENPWRRASENATYYSPKIQAPSEPRTRGPGEAYYCFAPVFIFFFDYLWMGKKTGGTDWI